MQCDESTRLAGIVLLSRGFGHMEPVAGLVAMSGCHAGGDGASVVSLSLMT